MGIATNRLLYYCLGLCTSFTHKGSVCFFFVCLFLFCFCFLLLLFCFFSKNRAAMILVVGIIYRRTVVLVKTARVDERYGNARLFYGHTCA